MATYSAPAGLWSCAFSGLILALIADGVSHVLSVILVATPLVAVATKISSAFRPGPGS